MQLGARPFFLVNEMEDGRLQRQLQKCTAGPFKKSDFSMGHRGAALQFPEHTRESYEAGARMGAGILAPSIPPQTPAELLGGTPDFRTNLYAGSTSGHLLTFKESIALFKQLGVKMTPELKAPSVTMPFDGFTQEMYAQKRIDELKAADVRPRDVFAQSFDIDDVLYWVQHEPAYGRQAVFLDDANVVADLPTFSDLMGLSQEGNPNLGAADVRAARARWLEPHRRLPGGARCQRGRARHHHLDIGTLRHSGRR